MLSNRLVHTSILFALLFFLASCSNGDTFFEESKEIPETGWRAEDAVVLTFDCQDTSANLDFHLEVMNDERYRYRNAYFFVGLKFPNEKWLKDTVECRLASGAGHWLGKKKGGDRYVTDFLYRYNRKLPMPGSYEIHISHGMRDEPLIGITAAGMRLINR